MRVEFSAFVETDLLDILEYIAADNPSRAVSFVREIRAHCRMLGENPLLYRLRPEIAPDARLVAHRHYVILFRVAGDVVRVMRIVHGSRDLPAAFNQGAPLS
jgi:toxin ParE1/3/4